VDGTAPDDCDRQIAELLRLDARRTFADIGSRVHLSAPAVKRRVDRLEASGVITGYTALVDHAKLGQPLEAFVELRFAGTTKVDDISSIGSGIPEVEAIYTTAGDPDALGHVRVRDVADLKRVIDLLRHTGRITGTKTLVVLGTMHPIRVVAATESAPPGVSRAEVRTSATTPPPG
jgi:Lrp/AsnC family leucine-responsive transcriptional regulator